MNNPKIYNPAKPNTTFININRYKELLQLKSQEHTEKIKKSAPKIRIAGKVKIFINPSILNYSKNQRKTNPNQVILQRTSCLTLRNATMIT